MIKLDDDFTWQPGYEPFGEHATLEYLPTGEKLSFTNSFGVTSEIECYKKTSDDDILAVVAIMAYEVMSD